jgi:hypothetical protein
LHLVRRNIDLPVDKRSRPVRSDRRKREVATPQPHTYC